jgi:hypothetical protein
MAATQARKVLTPSATTTTLMATGHVNIVKITAEIVSPAIALANKPMGTKGDRAIRALSLVSILLDGNDTA